MKQPRVPEYREGDSVSKYIKNLILFLKDFSMAVWRETQNASREIEGIDYPVTSVNGKTGDVKLEAGDVGAREGSWVPAAADLAGVQKGAWDGNTVPDELPEGISYTVVDDETDSGFPAGYAVCMAVKESGRRAFQMLIENAGGIQYIRSSADGTAWGSWQEYKPILETYPVGAIYMSVDSASPASLFGGTWEQLKDRFLIGAGESYENGSTGGSESETLKAEQLPKISGRVTAGSGKYGSGTDGYGAFRDASGVFSVTGAAKYGKPSNEEAWPSGSAYAHAEISFGGNQPHNNMPPYLAVYMWKRVA